MVKGKAERENNVYQEKNDIRNICYHLKYSKDFIFNKPLKIKLYIEKKIRLKTF